MLKLVNGVVATVGALVVLSVPAGQNAQARTRPEVVTAARTPSFERHAPRIQEAARCDGEFPNLGQCFCTLF